MSNLSWQLLTGRLSEAEYRDAIEAEYRGLRLVVGRPGWSTRWQRIGTATLTFVVLILLIVGVFGTILLAGAKVGAL